jgi:hypothetical protein
MEYKMGKFKEGVKTVARKIWKVEKYVGKKIYKGGKRFAKGTKRSAKAFGRGVTSMPMVFTAKGRRGLNRRAKKVSRQNKKR